MRIPVYRAEGGVTTQAPGRSFTARKNAQPFVNAALAQGQVVSEAANQVGQYAATRYKVITENNLNEALLGAEETLRTRSAELLDSSDYAKALDGDDPIWPREMEEVKQELRERIGGDRYALQQFDARFGQMELTQRFSLRSQIDTKIQQAAARARAQRLAGFEDTIANGYDLATVDLEARGIGIDSERWAASGAGNPDVLSAQEQEALARGTYRSIEQLVDNVGNPETVLDNIRSAIRDDDPNRAGPEGLYAYSLLQRLPYSKRQQILGSLGSDVSFFEAPTAEEEARRRAAEARGVQAGDQAAAFVSQLQSGVPVPTAAAGMPRAQLEAEAPFMSEAAYAAAAQQVADFEFVSGVAKTVNRIADPAKINDYVNTIKNSGMSGEGVPGIDTDRERMLLDFLSGYQSNMQAAIDNGGILDWARDTGAVPVGNVDMSLAAISNGSTGLEQRRRDHSAVAARYNIPTADVPVFSGAEASRIVEGLADMNVEQALASVTTLQGELGGLSSRGIQDLRNAGLPPEYVEMMYQQNPVIQRELLQVAGVDVSDLKQGLENTVPLGIQRELVASTSDYRIAFEAGGAKSGSDIFNEQFAVMEKLALSRARRRGLSAAEAVESVVSDILPPKENWLNQQNAQMIVPRGVNPNEVQLAIEYLSDETFLTDVIVPLDNVLLPEYADRGVSAGSLASTGVWLNNSTGDGVILHYNIDEEFIPAMRRNESGEIVEVQLKFDKAKEVAEVAFSREIGFGVNPDFKGSYLDGVEYRDQQDEQSAPTENLGQFEAYSEMGERMGDEARQAQEGNQ